MSIKKQNVLLLTTDASGNKIVQMPVTSIEQVQGLTAALAAKQGTLSVEEIAAVDSGVTGAKVTAYDAHLANADIHVTAEQKTAWSAKQGALSENQMNAVNSGITAAKVGAYDAYATDISNLETADTTLDGEITALETRVGTNESDIAELQAAVGIGDDGDDSLTDRISDAEDRLDDIDGTNGRLATIESNVTTLGSNKADKATTLAGYNISDAYTKTQVDDLFTSKLASALEYKGTKATYSALPASGNKVGDVWNIEAADSTHNVKAGDNVAWNGTGWDVLSGVVDLSAYYNKTEVDTAVGAVADDLDTLEGSFGTHAADTDLHVTAQKQAAWDAKQSALDVTQMAAVNSGINGTKVTGYDSHIGDTDIHVTTADKAEWSGKQDALSSTQLAAVNSGIDSTAKAAYDAYATNKLDASAAAGMLDANNKLDMYVKSEVDAAITALENKFNAHIKAYGAQVVMTSEEIKNEWGLTEPNL